MIVNFGSGANSAIRDAVLRTDWWDKTSRRLGFANFKVSYCNGWCLDDRQADTIIEALWWEAHKNHNIALDWCVNTYTSVHELIYKYKPTHTHTHLHYATSDWCVQADRRALKPDRLGWPMAQVLSRDQRNWLGSQICIFSQQPDEDYLMARYLSWKKRGNIQSTTEAFHSKEKQREISKAQ